MGLKETRSYFQSLHQSKGWPHIFIPSLKPKGNFVSRRKVGFLFSTAHFLVGLPAHDKGDNYHHTPRHWNNKRCKIPTTKGRISSNISKAYESQRPDRINSGKVICMALELLSSKESSKK